MNLVQYRMARGALNWTSRKVSVASGVQLTSISALQSKVAISEEEMSDIRRAFEAAGLEFLDIGDRYGVVMTAAATKAPRRAR
jgi:hypothetical protein